MQEACQLFEIANRLILLNSLPEKKERYALIWCIFELRTRMAQISGAGSALQAVEQVDHTRQQREQEQEQTVGDGVVARGHGITECGADGRVDARRSTSWWPSLARIRRSRHDVEPV